MANGQQGGGHQYTEEDVDALLNETARRAAAEAVKSARTRDAEPEDDLIGINPRLIKQLQTTVSVFNTLKDFTSGPLQKAIETKVGDLAAGVIEQAFTRPSGPPPRKDLVDTLLNSQFAYGLGSGLGQRAPELVESMGKTFGKDKAEEMIGDVIGKYGGGSSGPPGRQGGLKQVGSNPSGPPPEQQRADRQQSEMELLLSLDPNNPEHVTAYAESQGGLPVDTARKMLMIHQDAFIERLKKQGEDVSQLSMSRGSHTEKPPSQQGAPIQPTHQESPPKQANYVPPQQTDMEEHPEMEYTEYQEIEQTQGPNSPAKDDRQTDALKHFADDIGKIMGDMVNRIESLNNTVFVLQNELNEIKKQSTQKDQISPVPVDQPVTGTPTRITPPQPQQAVTAVSEEQLLSIPPQPQQAVTAVSEEQLLSTPTPPTPTWRRSEEFFEEEVQDMGDFMKELEEDTKPTKEPEKQPGVQTVPPQPQPAIQIPPTPSPTVKQPAQHIVQPIDISNIGEPKIGKVEVEEESKGTEKESKGRDITAKDGESGKEKIENKKYVTPINSRNIFAPSFKQREEPERSKDNNVDETVK